MKEHVSILGLGWLGLPLALELQKEGYVVSGSTTSSDNLKCLSEYSISTFKIKVTSDEICGDWKAFMQHTTTLIINFPPKRVANIATIHPLQIQQLIKKTPKSTKVIFVSSTSVYQDANTSVNEEMTCTPEKASGKALVRCESLLKDYFGSNLTILRLAGLIGPKRHPGRFLASKKALPNPNAPVNLIHQKDVIGLIKAILKQDCFGEIINGCADVHPKRKMFYEKAARQLNLPIPVFIDSEIEKFKIIDNSKSKALLEYAYEFSNPEGIFIKNGA